LIIAGVGYLIAFVAAIALLDSNNDTVSIVGFIAQVALWIVSSAHAFGIRSDVQELYAVREQPEIVAAKRRHVQRHDFEGLAREQPDVAYEAGIGQDHTRFGGLVDINHADAAEFVSLPGFTPALAAHVVELRERVDGFDSVLDFANLVDLPAHVLDRLRDRLICLPR
jgi:DNA uptake protein ComE-like DNA-binding protein